MQIRELIGLFDFLRDINALDLGGFLEAEHDIVYSPYTKKLSEHAFSKLSELGIMFDGESPDTYADYLENYSEDTYLSFYV